MDSFYLNRIKRYILSILLLLVPILYASAQNIWYSCSSCVQVQNVNDTSAWTDDPSGAPGNSPSTFSSSDTFHIINSDAMTASTTWTPTSGTGKMNLMIEDGGSFDAAIYDHSILLTMLGSASYLKTGNVAYAGLQFASIDPNSSFTITSVSNFRYDLVYPNLVFSINTTASGSGNSTAITLTQAITTTGNFEINVITSVTVRGATTTSQTHTIGGSLKVTAGNFVGTTSSGAPTFNIGGDLWVAGGVFTGASSSGSPKFNVTGNIQVDAGTFNGTTSTNTTVGNGSPIFTVTGGLYIAGGAFNGVNANTGVASPVFNLGGEFNYSGGIYKGVNRNSTATGTGVPTFNMQGASSFITAASISNANHKFNITGNITLNSNFKVGNALTISSGSLSISNYTLTLGYTLGITSGFLIGGSTSNLTFADSTASGDMPRVNANLPAVELSTLTISRPRTITMTGSVEVHSLLSIGANGTLSIGANTLTLDNNLSGSGSLSGGTTSNLLVAGTTSPSINIPAIVLNNLTLNRSAGIGMSGAISVGGTLTLTAGAISNSSQTLTLGSGSNILVDMGTISNPASFAGTVNVTYTGSTSVNTGNELPSQITYPNALNNLTFSKSGGTVTLQSPVTINGTLTISSGNQLLASSQPITANGNWINNNIFNPGTGTVTFAGTTALSGSGTHSFNHILISGTLTPPASGNVNIAGDFTNNGTFNSNSGTLTFNGTSAQAIGGSVTTDFNNITISKSSLSNSVSLSSAQRLIGTFTFANNTSAFNTNNQTFTLVSTASATARIAAIPTGATFSGDITMQRFVAAGSRTWHNISSAVSNGTVAQWQNGTYISGPFTGASDIPGYGTSTVTMQTYDANAGSWSRYPVSSNTEALSPRVGYRVYFVDGTGTSVTAKTLAESGPPNTGSQIFGLGYSSTGATGSSPADGWNLLGNPYPSDISADLTASGWTSKVNISQNAVYIYDATAKTYVSCNASTGGSACIIPSGQGFWVRATSSGASLACNENVKVTGSHSAYRVGISDAEQVAVKLTHSSTGVSNTTYLKLHPDATNGFDGEFDAYKLDFIAGFGLDSEAVAIATHGDSIYYSINARATISASDTVPLYVVSRPGKNTLDFSEQNFSSEIHLYLIDKYTGKVSDLKANPVYNFTVSTDSASQYERFSILFSSSATTAVGTATEENKDFYLYPNPAQGKSTRIVLHGLHEESVDIEVTDLSGKKVASQKCKVNNGTLEANLNISSLTPGIYSVSCKTASASYIQKLIIE